MEEERYSTTDFYTTAILMAMGFKVVDVTEGEASYKVKRFYFKDTKELRQTILLYMNGSLEGNLRTFRHAIENVKDLIHSS